MEQMSTFPAALSSLQTYFSPFQSCHFCPDLALVWALALVFPSVSAAP